MQLVINEANYGYIQMAQPSFQNISSHIIY